MFIDLIIVITLDRAKERRDNIEKELNKLNIKEKIFYLDAFDGNDMDKGINIFGKNMNRNFELGELGCTLSHITAIKITKSMGLKNVLILEDDVTLCDNFLEKLYDLEKILPKSFSQIYIGLSSHILSHNPNEKDKLVKIDYNVDCTHSYILNESAYDIVIKKLLKFDDATDGEYGFLRKHSMIDTYVFLPLLTHQNDSFSYIANKNKDMVSYTNKLFKK